MKTQGTSRTFKTPVLDASKTYLYSVRVEIQRDGKTQTVEHQQNVVAGQEFALTFEENTETAQLALASR